MRAFRILIIVLLLLCLIPPGSLLAVTLIARWARCELDQGAPMTCTVFGSDIGDFLFKAEDFGYYAIETLPTFVALLAVWIVVEIVRGLGQPRKPAPSKSKTQRQAPAGSRNRARGS